MPLSFRILNSKLDDIKNQLNEVPMLPGVYLWKNADGEVIYVGKAKALRARMKQYVNFADDRAKIPMLVSQIDSFEYIVVENENESLILEKNLIDQHKPFFNADFKDDKSYPYIALTTDCMFPAIKYTREKKRKGVKYFGPYTNSRAARNMVEVLRRIVPLCSTNCSEWKRIDRQLSKKGSNATREFVYEVVSKNENRPCFDSTVGLAPGICSMKISRDDYLKNVTLAENFLQGSRDEVLQVLRDDMQNCAQALDFEKASRIKQRIDSIEALSETQHIDLDNSTSIDVIGFFREETIAGVHVLIVREGKIVNSNEFVLNKGLDIPFDDLAHNFLLKYYTMSDSVAHEIVIRDADVFATDFGGWLTEKLNSNHGAKVHFTEPRRGEKLDLLKMAEINAKHTLVRHKVKSGYDDERTNDALLQLESALALDRPPLRIECFDISTNHGSYTVASMVVFTNGKPDKSQYRRFKIRADLDEANDFLSMQEVMRRRYCPERLEDERFGKKPDLVILDGGKPQLSAALEIFGEFGIDDINLVGLAKRDEELFTTWNDDGPVVLPSGSASLYLVKNIRDEAHRFAITFHRELRRKGQTKSILDEVDGIGPKRKKALLKFFGGFKKLCAASEKEIIECGVLNVDVAKEVWLVLDQYNNHKESTNS